MAKTRELLLAGSVVALAVGAMPVLAEPNVKLAQAQQQSEKDKDKAKQKGQPAKTQQPQQSPAAKPTTAPSQQPPAARTAPSQPSPQPAARTPPQQPSQQPAARTSPSQPTQSQPAARTQPSGGQTPSATQTQPGQRPSGRDQRPATVQQPGQPSSTTQSQPSTQDKPGQQRPASRDQGKPTTTQPAQAPATQTQPSTTQTQPSTTQPGQPGQPGQRPASREQRPTTTQQPGQAPTTTQRPGQAPAAQDKATQPGQAPTQQAQPPASQQPPATGQQPTWQQQQPAARTQPPGGQPSGGQPTVQDKLQPGMQQAPRQAVAPAPIGSQGQQLRKVEDLRGERRESREGNRVVIRESDRMIIRENGRTIIRHNEGDRFRRGGREVAVDRRGNEVMTVVERPDGTRIVTVVDNDGRLIRRARRTREGREVVIIDNRLAPRGSVNYFVDLPPPVIRIPRERYIVEADVASREDIYAALMAPPVDRIERRYTLDEVRYSPALRERMPRVDVDTITFESGSWELGPEQIEHLAVIAGGINQALASNPSEVFLIEGHTDATGSEEDNLSLSDRRAEAVAMALTEQFQVPAENLTTQGYGEQYLKIPTDGPERKNRRVSARRVTPLLNGDKSVGQAN